MTTMEILQAAQTARMPLALADTDTKNAALEAMAVALTAASDEILAANRRDLDAARGHISDVMLDRLALTPTRLADMAKGMKINKSLIDMGKGFTVKRVCMMAGGLFTKEQILEINAKLNKIKKKQK